MTVYIDTADWWIGYLNGMAMVKAHQPREPDCVHSRDYGPTQPMSCCDVCQHSPVLAEWVRYWREEGAQFIPPGWAAFTGGSAP